MDRFGVFLVHFISELLSIIQVPLSSDVSVICRGSSSSNHEMYVVLYKYLQYFHHDQNLNHNRRSHLSHLAASCHSPTKMSTLQNKTVVVVGGSSGIGFAVALAALQSQASTVIIASSNAERVAGAVKRLESHKLPGEVRGEVLDARDTTAVKEFSGRIGIVDHVAWTSGDVPHGVSGGDGESQEARTGDTRSDSDLSHIR